MQETHSYNEAMILFETLISIENSSIKAICIDDLFRKKHVFDNENNRVYIPDELVFVIKTFVFYDLKNENSISKYYEMMLKKYKIEIENKKKHFCLDYHS
jgi:hypothetical protein